MTFTVYVPAVVTVMDCVVAPFDHKLLIGDDDVSTTFPPGQKVVGPLAEIVGVEGKAIKLIVALADEED